MKPKYSRVHISWNKAFFNRFHSSSALVAQLGRAPIDLEFCRAPCRSRVRSPVAPMRKKFRGVQQSYGLIELISSII